MRLLFFFVFFKIFLYPFDSVFKAFNSFTDAPHQFRDLPSPKKQQYHQGNEDDLRGSQTEDQWYMVQHHDDCKKLPANVHYNLSFSAE